jgi:ABC-type Na+ efflux pump permease subunit
MRRPWLTWSLTQAFTWLIAFVVALTLARWGVQQFEGNHSVYIAALAVLNILGIASLYVFFSSIWNAAKRDRATRR